MQTVSFSFLSKTKLLKTLFFLQNLMQLSLEQVLSQEVFLIHIIDLPYSTYVPQGQWYVETPCFNLIQGVYYRRVEPEFTGLSIFDSREFLVLGLFYNAATDLWYNERCKVTIGVTSLDNSLTFIDSSASNACMFTMTNLYGNPSPSYTYSIEKYRI